MAGMLNPVTPILNQAEIATGNALPVSGYVPLGTGQLVRAGDATTYAAGDAIAQSTTAASCSPITFTVSASAAGAGNLLGCQCTVTAASGTIVISNFAFDLLVFRPVTNIPFTAGSYPADNAACNITAAAFKELVATFSFSATGWRNQAGANAAAGTVVHQSTPLSASVSGGTARNVAPFSLADLTTATTLLGIMQAQGTWNPGNVQQTFDFRLNSWGP